MKLFSHWPWRPLIPNAVNTNIDAFLYNAALQYGVEQNSHKEKPTGVDHYSICLAKLSMMKMLHVR